MRLFKKWYDDSNLFEAAKRGLRKGISPEDVRTIGPKGSRLVDVERNRLPQTERT